MKQGTLKALGAAALGAAFAATGAGTASATTAPPLTGTAADNAVATAAYHVTYRTDTVSRNIDHVVVSQAETVAPDAVPGQPAPRQQGGVMDSLPLSGPNPIGTGIPGDQVNAVDASLPGQPL